MIPRCQHYDHQRCCTRTTNHRMLSSLVKMRHVPGIDGSETMAMKGFDIGASWDIASWTLMAKWRHMSKVHARWRGPVVSRKGQPKSAPGVLPKK